MLLLFFSCISLASMAQWVSLNPGAGGQVQDIVCDPNTPNRVILASDMEGIYESLDNGNSWHHKGNLKQNRVYAVAVPFGNANKMFVGTLYGLEVSNNGGTTFSLVTQTKKMSIGAIAVDPNNQNNAIAGVGWRDDDTFAGNFGMSKNGDVVLYRTTNGGTTWSTINISGSGDRNVYTIQFDKSNSNNVYVGTSQGVFKSTNGGANWFSLDNDPGSNSGVALSANGQYLYGTFNNDLYVTSTSNINWQLKMSGLDGSASYWYPEVDPRSTGTSHKVTMAVLGDRPGLYEGTFDWSGSNVSNYAWKKIWEGLSGYDTGWDLATPNARVAHYTPTSWSRAIWSTSNQTIFQATPGGTGWGWNWNNKYSNKNTNFNVSGTSTYSSKGTASTYTFDVAVHKNYVIQGMADNGWMESWDSGTSWSNVQMRNAGNQSDVQSVDIGQAANGQFIVITDAAPQCYGGRCFSDATLWTKILSNTPSTSDRWKPVNGSTRSNNGVVDKGKYRDIAVSPAKKDRVFAASNDYGLYMIDDLGSAANEGSNTLKLIWNDNIRVKKIAPHPTNSNIVYLTVNGGNPSGGQGLYKGTSSNNGANWSFTKMNVAGSGWDSEVAVWMNGGQLYIVYYGQVNGETKGLLSMNDGASWNTIFDKNNATSINTPNWYAEVASDFKFSTKGGIAGYDNKIVLNYYDHRQQKTYGVYRGTINGASNVSWENWSGDIEFGGFTSAVIATPSDGIRYFYAATAGAGLLRRSLSGGSTNVIPTSVSISGCPGSNMAIGGTVDLNETVLPTNATNKSVTWSSSNNSVATVNSSGLVTAIAAGSATITVTTVSGSKTATCAVTVSAPTGGCTATGTILKEKYDGIIGTSISNLTGASIYPNSPSSTSQLTSFEVPTDAGDNYGLRVRGLICAPQTGTYTFWIAGDDAVELWLSTNTSQSNKVKIASHTSWTNSREWNKFSSQKSASISLTAGQSYYVEALMKEGTGGDNLAVGWRKPSDGSGSSPAEVIPGSVLSPSGTTTVIPTSVSISGCQSSLTVGATATLSASVSPSNASNKNVTWSTSNSSVATVSSSGVVTAVAVGSATITVTTVSGSKTATCGVTVNSNGGGSSSVTVRARMLSGSSDQLQLRINDATVKTWTVSGSSFANYTVSLAVDGNVKTYFPDNGTDMEIDYIIVDGTTYQAESQTVIPDNGTDMEIDYIIVDGTTYQAESQTVNTATWQNGSCGGSYSSKLYCSGYIDFGTISAATTVIPTSVSIAGCSGSSLAIGATANLDETVSPSNATNKNVTWSSSNTSVATVSNTGLVTAVSAGSATIIVTTVSGSKTATCGVTVSAPVCTNPSVVSNGEFDSGTANWQLYVNTTAGASWSVVTGAGLSGNNSAKATISNGGGTDSDIQLYSSIGSLSNGKTYQVTFKAKASGSRSIRVGVLRGASPWTNFLAENVNLTTSVQSFTLEFTMSENNSDARVDFFIGNNTNDVWIDAVAVKEKCAVGTQSSNNARFAQLSDIEEAPFSATIYPNPVSISDVLTVNFGTDSPSEVRVLSLNGQVIFSQQYNEVSAIKLPVAEMGINNAGLYFIYIQTNNKQKVQKLMIK